MDSEGSSGEAGCSKAPYQPVRSLRNDASEWITRDTSQGLPDSGRILFFQGVALHLLTSFHQTVASSEVSSLTIYRTLRLFVLIHDDAGSWMKFYVFPDAMSREKVAGCYTRSPSLNSVMISCSFCALDTSADTSSSTTTSLAQIQQSPLV